MRLLLSTLFILQTILAWGQPKLLPNYNREWKRADSLAAKGLPKSALAITNRIYAEARRQKNYPQVVKAAMHRLIFRSYADEDVYVDLVRSVKADIQDTPEPARSVLQSVLANIYWQYFQQNRYKFYNRTTVNRRAPASTTPSDTSAADFRTWDAQHLVSAATAAYLASVQSKQLLQNTPVAEFDVLVDRGDPGSRPLRPTLYDLLAHRALAFFQNTEPDLLKPVFKFSLDQPRYLATPDLFATLPIQSQDSLSGRYQALLLYQQLVTFHLKDTNPDALADVDVLRLAFVHTNSALPTRDTLYQQTLERQINQYKNKPAEAVYAYQLASFLADHGEAPQPTDDDSAPINTAGSANHWNRKQAVTICQDIIRRFPGTLATQKATRLVAELLQTSFSVEVENVTAPNQPFRALVSYQNTPKITYRIVRVSFEELYAYRYNRAYEEKAEVLLAGRLKRPKAAENAITLPDDGDLNRHTVEIPLMGLPMGQYVLLATSSDKLEPKDESIQLVFFTVSSLGYINLPDRAERGGQTLVVTSRTTGQPLGNISVGTIEGRNKEVVRHPELAKTNTNGLVKVPNNLLPRNQYWYLFTQGQDTLLSNQEYYYGGADNQEPPKTQTQIALFTDRAIYRPGQLIYVKGLLYSGQSNQYAVSANNGVTIELIGNKGESLSKQTVTTNEFGTFTATFIAPVGRLTGYISLRTSYGATGIRVEEYKRPTFEVKAQPIRQSFKLGQTVSFTAEAKTLSGAVLDKAVVRYRVIRQLRQRWYRWNRPRDAGQTEIINGNALTDTEGHITIAFMATPDLEQASNDNPIFDFTVTVDVTDPAGETRSLTKTLSIGYSALQAELTVPEHIEKGEAATFALKVVNQSEEKVPAKGQLTVYALQPPTRLLRTRLWNRPDRQFLTRPEFERLFPHDLYENEADPRLWPRGDVVQRQTVTFPNDSLIKPDWSKYPIGEYVAELIVTDSTGEKTANQAFFSFVDPARPTASASPGGWLQAQKITVPPGENAVFWVGNRQPGWVLMTVEENHTLTRREWIKTEGHPQIVKIPVTEKQQGGFAVHFAMIQLGRLYQESQLISVPFTNKQLTIETQTFRNKLKPGEREEWTLKINGLDKEPAEVVATLYDASLDAYSRLRWPTSFYQLYYSYSFGWESNSFNAVTSDAAFYHNWSLPSIPERRYDQLSWLGYQFTPAGIRSNKPSGKDSDALRGKVKRAGNTVSGVIREKDGSGTPGVNILIAGTSKGTVTDESGRFSIAVSPESQSITLMISYIGYVTKEIIVAKRELSFTMDASVSALSEVVVIANGASMKRGVTMGMAMRNAAPMAASDRVEELKEAVAAEFVLNSGRKTTKEEIPINPRKNFNETAFFMPQLKTDEQGRVVLKFTMPEALTRWRLLAFAHTKDMKTGMLEQEIVTRKELMITANAPRFFREGDTIQVRARLTNLSNRPLYDAVAKLTLTNAFTGQPLPQPQRTDANAIEILAPGLSTSVGWKIIVPKGIETVTCRVTAQSGLFTDGEEFTVPILPNRMLVTDTKPFWVNGSGETKEFKLKELANLNPELPVQHERLTVEVTSNPSWYALQSLPYLMEYRYECAEQLFSRLYANSLATHIVGSKPIFQQVIAEWQKNRDAGPSFRNPLQANEEVKAIALENSPWLADAQSEADRQARLGQLFDSNRMETEQIRAFEKLQQLQIASGGFSWFGGMTPDLAMTLHILGGLGHLQKLGVRFPNTIQSQMDGMITNAIRYADSELKRWVDEQKKIDEQKKTRSVTGWYFSAAQYLYARSFYLDKPVDKTVLAYVKQRVANDWLKQSLQGQALTAMALNRFGDVKTAKNILASLRERTRKSDELGIYWPDNVSGSYWYQTPVETQAYLIETFSEIEPVTAEIDDMKRWLLRQKQTQSWSSTKATTEAVYALLLRGSDWLSTGANTQVSLGGQPIENRVAKTDAITGYEKVTYAANEIKPEMGVIQITKKTDGPAWGALYWQHVEPLDQVMPGSTSLSVQKTLYVQRDSPNGPIINPITAQTSLKPGDLINVRIVLKTDRAMEYVHLKDSRAAGFEPVAALSGYKYQNGLGYYESPRDASTDFFLSSLPVGTHVFEYDLRVAQTGNFSTGVATVQCFYAPEFSAHSAGSRIKVQ